MPSNRFWDGMVRSYSVFVGGGGSVVEATVYVSSSLVFLIDLVGSAFAA